MPQQRGIGPGTASTWDVENHNVEGDETPEADRFGGHHAAGGARSALLLEPQIARGDGEDEESSTEIASSEVGKQEIEELTFRVCLKSHEAGSGRNAAKSDTLCQAQFQVYLRSGR